MYCEKCGKEMYWQILHSRQREEEGIPGYWYCPDCGTSDRRPAEQRYLDSNVFHQCSVAAIISRHVAAGISGETLLRLQEKEPSLSFMHREGNRIITHENSATAWGQWYEEQKHEHHRAKQSYAGWKSITHTSPGSAIVSSNFTQSNPSSGSVK